MWNKERMTFGVYLFMLLLAISPAFALGEGNRNLLLIGAMAISPIFLLRYPIIIPKIDIPLLCICFMIIMFPLLFHPETMRWSTLMYSCMFCLYFMAYVRILIFSNFTFENFIKLLRGLVFAFCIVLVIQQFCVLTGLPIFNVSNYNPLEPWKLNSLMAEPSHTARVLSLLVFIYMITYKQMTGITSLKEIILNDKYFFFAYIYCILTMGSGTAILLLVILLIGFMPIKNKLNISIYLLLLLSFLYVASHEIKSINRTSKFIVTLLQFDEKKLISEDLSAAIRIVPTIHGAKSVSIFSIDDLFGHGVDSDAKLTPLPSVDCGAGSFSIWYNFGFFTAILFWGFCLFICFLREKMVMSTFFWLFLCFFYGGLNNQLIWLTLCLFFTYKYLRDGVSDKRILG